MNRWMKFLRDCRDNYRDEVRLTKERQQRKAADQAVVMGRTGEVVGKVLTFVFVGLFIGLFMLLFYVGFGVLNTANTAQAQTLKDTTDWLHDFVSATGVTVRPETNEVVTA